MTNRATNIEELANKPLRHLSCVSPHGSYLLCVHLIAYTFSIHIQFVVLEKSPRLQRMCTVQMCGLSKLVAALSAFVAATVASMTAVVNNYKKGTE